MSKGGATVSSTELIAEKFLHAEARMDLFAVRGVEEVAEAGDAKHGGILGKQVASVMHQPLRPPTIARLA